MPPTIRTHTELVVLPKNHGSEDRVVELRRIRKHRVLNLIRENDQTSRAQLSRLTNYNLPNISSIVEELVREGLVRESAAKETPRGRRPVPISLVEDAAMIMGIDLGVTVTVGLLVNLRGKIVSRFEMPTPVFDCFDARVQWAVEFVGKFLSHAESDILPLAGIAVAIPGLVNTREEVDYDHRSVADPIRDAIHEAFAVPVLVDNDARMMALGALWFGAGRRYSTYVALNVTYGIGSGIVLEGRICHGAFRTAGEIGHLPLGEKGVRCYCGAEGCLENIASGSGLLRMAKKEGLAVSSVRELAELARGGDQTALAIFDQFAQALGRGIASISNLLSPQAIILSGPVCDTADLFLDAVKGYVERHTLPAFLNPPAIVISELGENAGALGACATVLHHIFHVSHLQLNEVF
ncbi:MAG: N-acetylglucosamine repressor [Candidatus Sumerlaeota bacterium]|nr:N-acetylglucosamine repressor [Candidatus Sumerlaeota bacterium]